MDEDRLADLQEKNPDLEVAEANENESYNIVGSAQFGTDQQIAKKLVEMKDRDLRSNVIQGLNSSKARSAQYENWINGVLAKSPKFGGTIQPLGFVSEDKTLRSGWRTIGLM